MSEVHRLVRLSSRATALIESTMARLQPLWTVGPEPIRSPLRGRPGAFVGLAVALLSTAFVVSLSGTFTPWAPGMYHVKSLVHAAHAALRSRSAYAISPSAEPFEESPFAAWASVLVALPNETLPLWAPVLWTVGHVALLWGFCRLLGLRDWRAGFLAACLPNIQPMRELLAMGDWQLALALVVTLDLVAPRGRVGGMLRGVATGLAVAWDPFLAPFVLLLWLGRGARAGIVAAATAAGATLFAAALSPSDSLRFFTEVLPGRLRVHENVAAGVGNLSPVSVWFRAFGVQPAMGVRVLLALLALATVAAAALLARRQRLLLAAALAGVAPLLVMTLVRPFHLGWIIVVASALVVGRVPLPTRAFGLLFVLVTVMQTWRLSSYQPDERPVVGLLTASAGAVAMALFALAAVVDAARLRGGEGAPGRVGAGVVHWVLVWLPFLVALWLAGTFFGSRLLPWHGGMPDFEVYVRAGEAVVHGRDVYATPGWPFLYPPFAAILSVPMGLGAGVREACAMLMQLLNAALFSVLLHRAGLRGWQVPFGVAFLFVVVQVMDADVRMGNVQGALIVMCLLDVVPGPGLLRRLLPFRWADRVRLVPDGVLTGIATSIKILPGLFIVHMLLTRRYRAAVTALVSCAVTTLLGVVLLPHAAVRFAKMLLHGELNHAISGGLLHYLSLVSGLERFWGYGPGAARAATLVSLVCGLVAFVAGLRWDRAGHAWFGAALVGMATTFLSPVAWNYYYIWLLPAALAVFRGRPDGRRLPEPLELLTLFLAGWATFQFHLALPAENNIEATYAFVHKVVAAMLPLGTALLGVLALAVRRGRRGEGGAGAAETDSAPAAVGPYS